MLALSGIVVWNAVSNTATLGTPGSALMQASMPAMLAGICSGPRWMFSRSSLSTSASTSTEPWKSVPV